MADNDALMAYAMGADSNNCNGGMWGGDGFGGLWGVIILAMIFGWGNGGFGGGFAGGNGGATTAIDASLQRGFDTQTIISKLDGINNGLCDGFYAMNTGILNGFHGVDNAVCQSSFQTQQGFNATQMAMMQGQNAIQNQIAQCCCDNRAAIADLKYDMATSDCSIKTLVNQLAQQLMWGQQNGIRDLTDLINDKFCRLEISQKDAVIADLRTQLSQCGDQNLANAIVARLTNVINPPAVPSYPAANPNGCGSWPASFLTYNNGYGYNNGCGCGCGCNV